MNSADFRRTALALPEAQERAHFGKADFRLRNRIFSSLPADDRGVVKLTPGEQQMLVEIEPAVFSPVNGGWGRRGWTVVALQAADEATLKSVLAMAWRNVAPPALRKSLAPKAGAMRAAEERETGAND